MKALFFYFLFFSSLLIVSSNVFANQVKVVAVDVKAKGGSTISV